MIVASHGLSPVDLSFLVRGCTLNTLSILNQLPCGRSIVERTPRFIRELKDLPKRASIEHSTGNVRSLVRRMAAASGFIWPRFLANCLRGCMRLQQPSRLAGFCAQAGRCRATTSCKGKQAPVAAQWPLAAVTVVRRRCILFKSTGR